MAKSSRSKSGSKTVLWIIIALIILAALLLALSFTPVGDEIIAKIRGISADDDRGGGSDKVFTAIGGNIVSGSGEILLENVGFEAHFIDVGQGDAILLKFPGNVEVMIDGGTTSSGLADYRTELVGYLNDVVSDDTIEYMIVTHPDTDHYNMLEAVMDAFVVGEVYYNDCDKNTTYSKFQDRVLEELGDEGTAIDADGETYTVLNTESYSLTVYAPGYDRFNTGDMTEYDAEESNGMSPFVVVETLNRTLIFTGDATVETEEWFMSAYSGSLDVDFIKIGHHGSDTSTSQEFLNFVNPEYCVIMCDDGSAYEHPSATVMNRLFDKGVVTYRTNRHGNIVLYIDASGDMAFAVEREVPVENNTVSGRSDLMLITEG